MTDKPTAYTLREAAALAGESIRTLRRRIAAGALTAHQIGANTSPLLVTPEALAEYLDGRSPMRVAAELSREELETLIRTIVREELARVTTTEDDEDDDIDFYPIPPALADAWDDEDDEDA